MFRCTRIGALVVVFAVSATSLARAQAGKQATNAKAISACSLLTAADIKKATGRSDLATGKPEAEEAPSHSNCIYSGAVDIGVTVDDEIPKMFDKMRDNYANAPARLGYRVEKVTGLGDAAYYLITKDRVLLKSLVGEHELMIGITALTILAKMPPEAEAKTLAMSLAKAGVAKLR